jgi:hypothetical protein
MADMQTLQRAVKGLRGWLDPLRFPGVVSVGVGYKRTAGARVVPEMLCIVVGVERKKPPEEVPPEQLIPREVEFEGQRLPTDVVQVGKIRAQALTTRERPCPGGFSCGHESITAGTLGAWVHRDNDPEGWYILSNNHVLAASNSASLGSPILQPGKADGGGLVDRIATLTEFVTIHFDEKQKGGGAAMFWRGAKWLPNRIAQATGCPYRLKLERLPTIAQQQQANVVDAAVAKTVSNDAVKPEIHTIGVPAGFRDLNLDDRVQKTGRTTMHTRGIVDQVSATVQVDYGDAGTATFEDQVVVRPEGGGDFSAGGDSGSVVLDDERNLGGLLFAGGEGTTILNRMSNVVAALKIRL